MAFALGALRWKPETFWNATFYEVSCAYVGYCQAKGVGPYSGHSAEDIEELREDIEAMREQFPDRQMTKDEWRNVRRTLH